MDTITEPTRQIPVADEVDLCVVGGSCTGLFAAVSAARLGARVAIVESNGFFGGSATASLVNVWHSQFDTTGQQRIIAGLTLETVDRLDRRQAVHFFHPANETRYTVLNTEELKIELDQLALDAGIRPFLHAHFAAPVVEDGKLTAVIFEDKTGRRAIRASHFIDATGDGDLISRAGLPCYKPDHLQPPTTSAIIRGLGDIKQRHPDFDLTRVAFDPAYPQALERGFLWTAEVPGSAADTMVAGTRMFGTDSSDADQLTAAEIEGRRQVRALCDILRENFLPEGSVPLVGLPTKIGLRESRHARCLHQLTEEELLHGHRFPDGIANGTYRVDVHHMDKPGITFRYLDGREEYSVPGRPAELGRWLEEGAETATFYQIPYSSLVPQQSTNLLVAGRLVDADQAAYGAVRVMVTCNQTGEAAGTAAYLALDAGIGVADVDPQKLRTTMTAAGSLIV